MTQKSAHPKTEDGPITRGKGLDTLDRFIIQNWAAPTRFGLWNKYTGTLAAPKASLEHFFNDALKDGWLRDGCGAVITIDPPRDPFVTIRVEHESKSWSVDAKYNPKHWVWKVVPTESALAALEAALQLALPEAESSYLLSLQQDKLNAFWGALAAVHP